MGVASANKCTPRGFASRRHDCLLACSHHANRRPVLTARPASGSRFVFRIRVRVASYVTRNAYMFGAAILCT